MGFVSIDKMVLNEGGTWRVFPRQEHIPWGQGGAGGKEKWWATAPQRRKDGEKLLSRWPHGQHSWDSRTLSTPWSHKGDLERQVQMLITGEGGSHHPQHHFIFTSTVSLRPGTLSAVPSLGCPYPASLQRLQGLVSPMPLDFTGASFEGAASQLSDASSIQLT